MGLREIAWIRSPVTRRRVLQLLALATGAVLQPRFPARAGIAVRPNESYGFLTAMELTTLDAATELLLPSDSLPGAREIGVVGYIQSLLSYGPGADANCDQEVDVADVSATQGKALMQFLGCPEGGDVNADGRVDRADIGAAEAATFRARPMFGGGPFSGRNPQPHFPVGGRPCNACHGANGEDALTAGGAGRDRVDLYPPNTFRQFLPLNRLQKMSWKARLLGGQAVPEVADNPLLEELAEVNLRRRYRDGLASVDEISQERFALGFAALSLDRQRRVLDAADPRFVRLLQLHVIQGTFCVPEYGGNRNQIGWQMTGFDGDSQPLGYEIYDESVPGFYRERADKPNSGPNPDEDCRGFSTDMKRFLDLITRITGGGPLADPYCFEVDR